METLEMKDFYKFLKNEANKDFKIVSADSSKRLEFNIKSKKDNNLFDETYRLENTKFKRISGYRKYLNESAKNYDYFSYISSLATNNINIDNNGESTSELYGISAAKISKSEKTSNNNFTINTNINIEPQITVYKENNIQFNSPKLEFVSLSINSNLSNYEIQSDNLDNSAFTLPISEKLGKNTTETDVLEMNDMFIKNTESNYFNYLGLTGYNSNSLVLQKNKSTISYSLGTYKLSIQNGVTEADSPSCFLDVSGYITIFCESDSSHENNFVGFKVFEKGSEEALKYSSEKGIIKVYSNELEEVT